MMKLCTFHELFAHNDWARDKLLAASVELSDAQLDRPFEMGEGSLRRTLNHLFAAERVWLDRWIGTPARYRDDAAGVSLRQLSDEFTAAAAERNEWLAQRCDADLPVRQGITNSKGQSLSLELGQMLLHVCNHGVHHRAQATNMLRRLGAPVPKPGLDYIFMKLEQPGGGTAKAQVPALDVGAIDAYFVYGDWAQQRVLEAAGTLAPNQLDRPFEIGLGTLRKTLLHIRFAEQWWLQNWTAGPGGPFPELPETTSIAQLREACGQTAAARKAYLQSVDDKGLNLVVHARPRPEIQRSFSLGATLLQLCCHGTLHRAQALNMLRHVGAEVPALDVVTRLRLLGLA